jgi:hypothetical protein
VDITNHARYNIHVGLSFHLSDFRFHLSPHFVRLNLDYAFIISALATSSVRNPQPHVISTEQSDERSQKKHIEISHTRFDMTNRKGERIGKPSV